MCVQFGSGEGGIRQERYMQCGILDLTPEQKKKDNSGKTSK